MSWRESLSNPNAKKNAMMGGIALLGALVGYFLWGYFSLSSAARLSRDGLYIDSATGKPFHHQIQEGDRIPLPAPSGGNTGYPAELCFWNKDGTIRTEPVPVLLNEYLGKRQPTFCPDCGRLVVSHNPSPQEGDKAPPTVSEYAMRRNGEGGAQ